jgi:hypothetical protein
MHFDALQQVSNRIEALGSRQVRLLDYSRHEKFAARLQTFKERKYGPAGFTDWPTPALARSESIPTCLCLSLILLLFLTGQFHERILQPQAQVLPALTIGKPARFADKYQPCRHGCFEGACIPMALASIQSPRRIMHVHLL